MFDNNQIKTNNIKKTADILDKFGVLGGMFIIPACVYYFANNKYIALVSMILFTGIPLFISKRLKQQVKDDNSPHDYNKELRDWFKDYERE